MARSIANFLVGIGLDTKEWDKGSRKVETNLDSFRSKAGLAGGALAAAFGAISVAAITAGTDADKFMRKVSSMDTSAKFVYSLGNAFGRLGGSAEDAYKAISRGEEVLGQLRAGDASALTSATRSSGLDLQSLQKATTGEDFVMRLSDILAQPGVQQWQKRALQEEFGISNEALKGMERGSEHLKSLIADAEKYTGNLEKAAQAGREYSAALSKITQQFTFIGQELAASVLPRFTTLLEGFSGFLDRNMDKVPAIADFAKENAGGIGAAGAGLSLSAVGAMAAKWLPTIGKAAVTTGKLTTAAGAASMLLDVKPKHIEAVTGVKVNPYIFEKTPADAARDLKKMWNEREQMPETPITKDLESPAFYPSRRRATKDAAPMPSGWWRSSVSQDEASKTSPSYAATVNTGTSLAQKPVTQEAKQPIVINADLTLNGREMAKFVREVNAEQQLESYTEVTSTVSR